MENRRYYLVSTGIKQKFDARKKLVKAATCGTIGEIESAYNELMRLENGEHIATRIGGYRMILTNNGHSFSNYDQFKEYIKNSGMIILDGERKIVDNVSFFDDVDETMRRYNSGSFVFGSGTENGEWTDKDGYRFCNGMLP